jgi:16S rRNA (cytosine967-C5)-methyltransferase
MPIAAPRALAFEVLRETFERHGHTELAFRAAAERLELDGRGRAIRLLDPPVAAALRLGLYELLFADATPDHAAVDQAVELVKIAKAAHASGFVNAILRRAARERAELTAALLGDDSTPEAASIAHSAPLWLVRMWWAPGRSTSPRRWCSPAGSATRCRAWSSRAR